MLKTTGHGLEALICSNFTTENLRQCRPLLIVFHGDGAPAVLALAGIAIMRRAEDRGVAHRLGIAAGSGRIHKTCADHERRCLRLGQIDERAFLLPVAVEHAGNNDDGTQHAGSVIGINRLRTDGRIGNAGMIPQVSESRERRNVHADGRIMALRPGGAETRHAQVDNVGLDLA